MPNLEGTYNPRFKLFQRLEKERKPPRYVLQRSVLQSEHELDTATVQGQQEKEIKEIAEHGALGTDGERQNTSETLTPTIPSQPQLGHPDSRLERLHSHQLHENVK